MGSSTKDDEIRSGSGYTSATATKTPSPTATKTLITESDLKYYHEAGVLDYRQWAAELEVRHSDWTPQRVQQEMDSQYASIHSSKTGALTEGGKDGLSSVRNSVNQYGAPTWHTPSPTPSPTSTPTPRTAFSGEAWGPRDVAEEAAMAEGTGAYTPPPTASTGGSYRDPGASGSGSGAGGTRSAQTDAAIRAAAFAQLQQQYGALIKDVKTDEKGNVTGFRYYDPTIQGITHTASWDAAKDMFKFTALDKPIQLSRTEGLTQAQTQITRPFTGSTAKTTTIPLGGPTGDTAKPKLAFNIAGNNGTPHGVYDAPYFDAVAAARGQPRSMIDYQKELLGGQDGYLPLEAHGGVGFETSNSNPAYSRRVGAASFQLTSPTLGGFGASYHPNMLGTMPINSAASYQAERRGEPPGYVAENPTSEKQAIYDAVAYQAMLGALEKAGLPVGSGMATSTLLRAAQMSGLMSGDAAHDQYIEDTMGADQRGGQQVYSDEQIAAMLSPSQIQYQNVEQLPSGGWTGSYIDEGGVEHSAGGSGSVPAYGKGGDVMVGGPAVLVDLNSGDPVAMIAEAGKKERMSPDGDRVKITPTSQPQAQQGMANRAVHNPFLRPTPPGLPSPMGMPSMRPIKGFAEGGYYVPIGDPDNPDGLQWVSTNTDTSSGTYTGAGATGYEPTPTTAPTQDAVTQVPPPASAPTPTYTAPEPTPTYTAPVQATTTTAPAPTTQWVTSAVGDGYYTGAGPTGWQTQVAPAPAPVAPAPAPTQTLQTTAAGTGTYTGAGPTGWQAPAPTATIPENTLPNAGVISTSPPPTLTPAPEPLPTLPGPVAPIAPLPPAATGDLSQAVVDAIKQAQVQRQRETDYYKYQQAGLQTPSPIDLPLSFQAQYPANQYISSGIYPRYPMPQALNEALSDPYGTRAASNQRALQPSYSSGGSSFSPSGPSGSVLSQLTQLIQATNPTTDPVQQALQQTTYGPPSDQLVYTPLGWQTVPYTQSFGGTGQVIGSAADQLMWTPLGWQPLPYSGPGEYVA